MDITPSNMNLIFTGLSTAFNVQLASTETHYGKVAMTVPSATASNEYPRMDDLPGIREWVGDRVIHDLSMQTYNIKNRKFEQTIGISRDQIEDDQMGLFGSVSAQLAQNAAQFPDELVFPLLKAGNTTKCYDDQYFFDTDHPGWDENGDETSISNFTAGAGAAWYLIDDTKVIKPMIFQKRKDFKLIKMDDEKDDNVFNKDRFVYGVDGRCAAGFGLWQLAHMSKATLDAANYEAARIAMGTIRKRNGSTIAIRPAKLLVPPALESAARRIVQQERIDGGDTNIWLKTAEVIVIPHLQ